MEELQAGDPLRIGPYAISARLGAGGMGQVFLGRSQGGRLVAVKVIHPEWARDREFRARFAREVAVARTVGGFFTAPVVDADNTSVAGMSLHSPYQRSTVRVPQLPANAQIALGQTISSKGLADAQGMVSSVQTEVGQCRQQWRRLAAWKTADDKYQRDLARYNQLLVAVNQHNAHLKAGQQPTAPPAAPAKPGPEPQVPQAGSCGPASAFGIAPADLPPGTADRGSVP